MRFIFIAAFLVASALIGCTSPPAMDSVKDPGHRYRRARYQILIEDEKQTAGILKGLDTSAVSAFASIGLEAAVTHDDYLALNKKTLADLRGEDSTAYALIIKVAALSYYNEMIDKLVLQADMVDLANGKKVWKMTVDMSGYPIGDLRHRDFWKLMLKKAKEDQVIVGESGEK